MAWCVLTRCHWKVALKKFHKSAQSQAKNKNRKFVSGTSNSYQHQEDYWIWNCQGRAIYGLERKEEEEGKQLYNEGSVVDDAKLGLPVAQGIVADSYFEGTNGVEKGIDKGFKFAKESATGGGRLG